MSSNNIIGDSIPSPGESSKICRVCMCIAGQYDIFSASNNCGGVFINKLIMLIGNVQISEDDGLPTDICNKCLLDLKVAITFKRKCEYSDTILRKKLPVKVSQALKDELLPLVNNTLDSSSINSVKQEILGDDTTMSEPLCYVECLLSNAEFNATMACDIDVLAQAIEEDPLPIKINTKEETNKLIESDTIATDTPVKEEIVSEEPKLRRRPGRPRTVNREIPDNEDDEYPCDMCEKTFTNSILLKKHIKQHTEPKLYQCEVCKKLFRQNSHLQRHLLIHTGMKPFTCEVCHKSFKQKPHLTRHVSVHTGVKPYQCEICGKNFITTSDLNKHSIIHTGQRPFQCEICGKGYNNTSDLNKHLIRKHEHDKYRFQCTVCSIQFNTGKNLNQHMLVHCQSDTIWTKVGNKQNFCYKN